MRFIDEATIEIAAGDGGRGCVSFLRQRFQPKGGPDGGDGGRGGHVILRADSGVATLADHSYLRHFRAGRGGYGSGSNKTGAGGEDKVILVPAGTIATDVETGEVLADLTRPDQEIILVHGGRGGKGNRHFVSSTHRAPRFAQPGEEGEKRVVRLTLKLLADVGLIGLPNAGKSSLIAALTAARPKIGDYPFTTLAPNLGIVHLPDERTLTLADIPGLVAGAHQGTGLGLRFLRHIERTRLFVYVVDLAGQSPVDDLHTVLEELAAYDEALRARAGLVVGNKMDLKPDADLVEEFKAEAARLGLELVIISALNGRGLDEFVNLLARKVKEPVDDETSHPSSL